MLEDITVILVHAESLIGSFFRLNELANAQRAVRVYPPRQLKPELVLLPDLAGVDFARVRDALALTLARGTQHWLAKAYPLRVARFVGMKIVALRAVAHRQDIVREVRGLVPRRGQSHVTINEALVRQSLDP